MPFTPNAAGDVPAFADAVGSLLTDDARRESYGSAAGHFAAGERALDRAAIRLHTALAPLLAVTKA